MGKGRSMSLAAWVCVAAVLCGPAGALSVHYEVSGGAAAVRAVEGEDEVALSLARPRPAADEPAPPDAPSLAHEWERREPAPGSFAHDSAAKAAAVASDASRTASWYVPIAGWIVLGVANQDKTSGHQNRVTMDGPYGEWSPDAYARDVLQQQLYEAFAQGTLPLLASAFGLVDALVRETASAARPLAARLDAVHVPAGRVEAETPRANLSPAGEAARVLDRAAEGLPTFRGSADADSLLHAPESSRLPASAPSSPALLLASHSNPAGSFVAAAQTATPVATDAASSLGAPSAAASSVERLATSGAHGRLPATEDRFPLLSGAAAAALASLAALAALYHRLRRPELLEQASREAILAHVRLNPACTATDVARALAMDRSTVRHHLRVLSQHGFLRARSEGRSTYYLVNDGLVGPSEARRILAAESGEANVRFLEAVAALPGLCQRDAAARLALAPSTVSERVRRLEARGWIDRRFGALRVTEEGSRLLAALREP